MQRIERYGVIALVFLLVTIMAVALWGQREEQGLLSFMKKAELSEQELQASAPKGALPIAENRRPGSGLPMSADSKGNGERARGSLRDSPPSATPLTNRPPSARTLDEFKRSLEKSGSSRSTSLAEGVPTSHRTTRKKAAGVRVPKAGPVETRARKNQVEVRRGDTLSHIAQRELGSAKRWREILAVNEGLDPKRMFEGTVLNMPSGKTTASAQRPSTPAPALPKSARVNGSGTSHAKGYTVRKGDTLSQIALDQLGRATRWKEIVDLNPGLDPQRMFEGTHIVLPTAQRSAPALAESRSKPARARSDEIARATPRSGRVR